MPYDAAIGGTVDGVVDRAPHADVVERRMRRVEEEAGPSPGRAHVHLRREARSEVLERLDVLGLLERAEVDVGAPLLDRRDAAWLGRPSLSSISSGNPSGRATLDHTRKYGLRTSVSARFGT